MKRIIAALLLCAATATQALAQYSALQVPKVISYQGRVTQNGTPWNPGTGEGYFVFALVQNGSVLWNNYDGNANPTDPASVGLGVDQMLSLPVSGGQFSVRLGASGNSGTNREIPSTVFFDASTNSVRGNVKLAVWFSADANTFYRLGEVPDNAATTMVNEHQLNDIDLASVPYAMVAGITETVQDRAISTAKLADGAVTAGKMAAGAAVGNLGQAGALVQSADPASPQLLAAGYVNVGRLKTTNGVWRASKPKSTDAPSPRNAPSVVWTDSEMIIWGGACDDPRSGGRYNPTTNTWQAINLVGAPPATGGSVVWTGTEMIVWGGNINGTDLNSGRRYNPATDTWAPMSMTGAPSVRSGHGAVWTGTEMIVWGGWHGSSALSTGGRYNPVTDTWQDVSNTGAPGGRNGHSMVWTKTAGVMVVWGGWNGSNNLNTGGRYNPATNSWQTVTTTNAPTLRSGHTAVWTNSEMIVWGGMNGGGYLNTGARYNPTADSWVATSTTNAPTARAGNTVVWTGSEMIVWGGGDGTQRPIDGYGLKTGARYSPTGGAGAGTWQATSETAVPTARYGHAAVWTGTRMLVWGGIYGDYSSLTNSGGSYAPVTNSWQALDSPGPPSGRERHAVVWTESEMVVWGGRDETYALPNTGGRYAPDTGTWQNTTTVGAPSGRENMTAVWTGTDMIIWGGWDGTSNVNTGGRYNPATNTWQPVSTTSAPAGRSEHAAVWTGTEMIVWGGYNGTSSLNTGARYNPSTNTWQPLPTTGAPAARASHTAVWTGSEMIVWGGLLDGSGGLYNPTTNTWRPMSLSLAPAFPYPHTAVWTGSEMIVWGNLDGSNAEGGGRYSAADDIWTPLDPAEAGPGVYMHTAVWTGQEMITWGGDAYSSGTINWGKHYTSYDGSWAATATLNAPRGRYRHTAVWTGREMLVFGGVFTLDTFFGPFTWDNKVHHYTPTPAFLYSKP